jgi:hypothetical protein
MTETWHQQSQHPPLWQGNSIKNRAPQDGACGSKTIPDESLLPGSFLDGHGVFADAAAEVVQFGPADLAALRDFDLGNQGAMDRVNAFHAFAVAELADGDGLALGEAALADDDAGKNLDALLAAFNDPVMDLDCITDVQFGGIGLHLLAVDLLEDIHGGAVPID